MKFISYLIRNNLVIHAHTRYTFDIIHKCENHVFLPHHRNSRTLYKEKYQTPRKSYPASTPPSLSLSISLGPKISPRPTDRRRNFPSPKINAAASRPAHVALCASSTPERSTKPAIVVLYWPLSAMDIIEWLNAERPNQLRSDNIFAATVAVCIMLTMHLVWSYFMARCCYVKMKITRQHNERRSKYIAVPQKERRDSNERSSSLSTISAVWGRSRKKALDGPWLVYFSTQFSHNFFASLLHT